MVRKTIFLTLSAVLLLATSCTLAEMEGMRPAALVPEGNPVSVNLDLTVSGLSMNTVTRADVPAEDRESERRVSDLWIFQYDYSTGSLLTLDNQTVVRYKTISDQNELKNIEGVTLSDNNGNPSVIYVVANTNDSSWASSATVTSTFGTLNGLKMTVIPNAAPRRVDSSGDEGATTEEQMTIPMGGSLGEDGDLIVAAGEFMTVPISRMFAKLYVYLTIVKGADDDDVLDAEITSLYIEKIPNLSTVATVTNSDGSWYYSEEMKFEVSRVFLPEQSYVEEISNDDMEGTRYGPYVLYVPENLQGSSNSDENAIRITPYIYATAENGAQIVSRPSYTAYPGSWNATTSDDYYTDDAGNTDFNIKRNCVYDITINVSVKSEDLITPSANSIIVVPGTTVAFFPYVRDEECSEEMMEDADWESVYKSRYDFSTYLDPYDETGAKTIAYVDLIWQTQDCIGDVTQNDKLVWIDDAAQEGEFSGDVERRRKIYVTANKSGNALIAAYNKNDVILWSWHIWVTDINPEDSAIEYYHLDWDTDGIKTGVFVPGRLVMNCSLGAQKYYPDEPGIPDFDTYGLLYQWGRKDPFPSISSYTGTPGTKGGKMFPNYSDYSLTISDKGTYTIKVGIYDKTNTSMPMTDNDGAFGGNSTKDKYLFWTGAPSNMPNGTFGSTDDEIILSTIQNPTAYVASSDAVFTSNTSGTAANNGSFYYNMADWLIDNDDFLWGGGHPSSHKELKMTDYSNLTDDYGPNKTIFDPCPYGWRVTPGDIWLGFTLNGTNWSIGSSGAATSFANNCNCVEAATYQDPQDGIVTVNNQCGYTMYMQGWHGSYGNATSFFPIQSARLGSGQPYLVGGICGNYHNATTDEDMQKTYTQDGVSYPYLSRHVDIIHFHAEQSSSYTVGHNIFIQPFPSDLYYSCKSTAGPLRCVRDTK